MCYFDLDISGNRWKLMVVIANEPAERRREAGEAVAL